MSEPPLLAVRDLDAFYGDFQALFGLSMELNAGEAVAVIGANGAGKSTLLKSIAGLLRARPDAITFDGVRIGGMPAHAVAAQGIALVPEGRGLFRLAQRRRKSGDRRSAQTTRALEFAAHLPALSRARRTPAAAEHRAIRRSAADGRDRPRPDVESEIAVVRRDQPRPGADHGARHLRAPAGDSRTRAFRCCWSSRTSRRRSRRRSASIACKRAEWRSRVRPRI